MNDSYSSTAKPVCCESAAANGLINIGCVPVTL